MKYRTMRVVHILNTDKFSGAENVAIQIIDYTNKTTDIESVYVSLDGPIRDTLEQYNINFYPVERVNFSNIKKMISELKPDILHCHDYTTSIVAAFSTSKKIISHLHNNSPWLKKYGAKSFEYLVSIPRYSRVFLVSDSIKNEYVFARCLLKKCDTIGNPVDVKKIKANGAEKVAGEGYDICFLGRFSPEKRPLLFVEIIQELVKKDSLIKACMIGDGELGEQVKKKVNELKLTDNIELLGFQTNPYPYLNKSKFLLATSEWEGYGLFAVEALVLGKPVVCTNVGGLPTIVDYRCGEICKNKAELIQACKKMLYDTEYYDEKQKGTKVRITEFPDVETYMENIIGLYCNLSKPENN